MRPGLEIDKIGEIGFNPDDTISMHGFLNRSGALGERGEVELFGKAVNPDKHV